MDPLSVAASVVGLPAAGNKVASLLSTKCKGSPSLAAGINEGVADISDALYRLQDLVSGRSKAVAERGSQIQLDQLLTTLTGCVMTYSDLQQFIHTSPNINEGMRTSDCINTFVQRLQSYKFSLRLMLTIMQWYRPKTTLFHLRAYLTSCQRIYERSTKLCTEAMRSG